MKKENSETHSKVQTNHHNPPIINRKPPSQQTHKPTTTSPTAPPSTTSSPTHHLQTQQNCNPANPKTHKPSKPTTTSPTALRRPQPRAHRPITNKPATQQTRKPTNLANPQTHNHQQTRNPDLTDPSPATQNRHTYQQPITRSGKKKKQKPRSHRPITSNPNPAPEGLLCEIAKGGMELCKKERGSRKGGGGERL